MPQTGLLVLNLLAIAVGVATITEENRIGVVLAIAWAALHSLILGRIVLEAFVDASRERRALRAPADLTLSTKGAT